MSYFNNVVANGYKVNGKYVYASSHYVIDIDGTIYQLIPTDERCYATNEANSYAIAIEVATTGKDNHYTDATYKAMVHLCAWLCQYKGLDFDVDEIVNLGKASIVSNRINCTGKATINSLIENVIELYKMNFEIMD